MKTIVQSDQRNIQGGNSRRNSLQLGDKLNPGDQLTSANGLFFAIYQTDGNFVLYDQAHGGQPQWHTNTAPTKPGYLQFAAHGNLIIKDHGGDTIWNTNTAGQGATQVILQNNGNLVMYTADGTAVWQTNTVIGLPTYTRDTLMAGDIMIPGDILLSKSKMFLMQFRTDGMLYLHDASGVTLWNTDAYPDAAILTVTIPGNFELHDSKGNVLWKALGNLSSQNKNSHVTIQDDGNMVLYTPSGLAPWSSNSLSPVPQGANPIPVTSNVNCGAVVDGGAEAVSVCGAVTTVTDGGAVAISGIGFCAAVYTGASFCGVVGNGVAACGADFSTFGVCGAVAAFVSAGIATASAIGACGVVAAVASACGAVLSGAGTAALGASGASACGAVACGAEACGAAAEGAGACAEAKGAGACGANATVAEGSGVCGAQAGFCGAVACIAFPIGGNW